MSVTRDVMRHSAVYGIANVVGRLASFLLLPLYARIFDTTGYGILGMIEASSGLLSIAFGGIAQSAFLRIYHEAAPDRKAGVVGTSIGLCWVIGLGVIVLPVIFSPVLSSVLLGSREYWNCIVLALVALVINIAGENASTTLLIRQKSVAYSLINLLSLFVAVGLNIVLVVWLKVGLIGVFIASLSASAITSACFHWLAFRAYGFHFERQLARRICTFWFPLIPGEIVAYLARQAERFYVRFLLGIDSLGILEMAYKFAPTLNLFIMLPFMRAWRTKSLEVAASKDGPEVIGKMFTDFMLLMLFGGVMLAVSLPELLRLMTPPDFWPAARIGQIEICTTIFGAAINYFLFGLLYAHRTSEISWIKGTVAVVKVVLSYWLVATWGLSGAAYSALVMNIVTFLWIYNRAQFSYRLRIEWRLIGAACACAFGITLLSAALTDGSHQHLTQAVRHSVIEPMVGALARVMSAGNSGSRIATALVERQDVLSNLAVSLCIGALFILVAGRVRPGLFRGMMMRPRGGQKKS
jgi:O-antigen/teichoic acid export membrane protein